MSDCEYGFQITPVDPTKPSVMRNCKIVASGKSPIMEDDAFAPGSEFVGCHFETIPAEPADADDTNPKGGDDMEPTTGDGQPRMPDGRKGGRGIDNFPEEAFREWWGNDGVGGFQDCARWAWARGRQESWFGVKEAMSKRIKQAEAERDAAREERDEARKFGEEAAAKYNDLLADHRILRCAFCGAAYPPDTPPTQHEALTAHVMECPAHPLATDLTAAQERVKELENPDSARVVAIGGEMLTGGEIYARSLEEVNIRHALRAENARLRDALEKAETRLSDAWYAFEPAFNGADPEAGMDSADWWDQMNATRAALKEGE